MSTTVRQMLQGKSAVHTVSPDDTVLDALRLMAERNIGAVIVLTEGRLEGILSERDYARKVVLLGKASKETPVREIMTTEVVTIDPGWSAEQCMALMNQRRVRHLPVLEDDQLVGIVSIGDIVRTVVDEQQFAIASLESYIANGR
jgi:CBS domain-containing protein